MPRTIPSMSPLWALLPSATMRALGISASVPSDWEATKPTVQGKGPNKTAIIPIEGVLSKGGPSWYGSSYDSITSALEQAGADPDVKRVILSVDSPGGDVAGLQEAATVLAQVAKIKPVSAIVEGTSASAAYWLTSQAHDITLTPSGEVGSVGVRMMHIDASKALEDMGYKVTELYSGDFKTEWSPYKPLSEEATSDMQPRLEAVHNDFISAIQAGRGNRATDELKAKRFGEGRMFSATDALSNGLVDKIQAPRDFFRAMVPEPEATAAFGFRRARLELEKRRFPK